MNAKDAVTRLARRSTGDEDGDEDADGSRPTEQGRPEDVDPLPLDAVFELLKNQRRRHTLDYLRNNEGPVTLSDLAEHVAAIENDTSTEALSSDERKRAYVGLYQCHLPKMDEMDAVDFNRDRGKIELGPNAHQLFPYLDIDETEETRDWPRYYLGLSGLCAGALAVGLVAGVGTNLAAVGAVLAFGALSVAHYRTGEE